MPAQLLMLLLGGLKRGDGLRETYNRPGTEAQAVDLGTRYDVTYMLPYAGKCTPRPELHYQKRRGSKNFECFSNSLLSSLA